MSWNQKQWLSASMCRWACASLQLRLLLQHCSWRTVMQELEAQLQERSLDQTAMASTLEQAQEMSAKLQRMAGVYEKAVTERDEFAKQTRATSVQLSHQRLTVAHLQRQVDRARRENMKLRAEVRDLSAGRHPQVWPTAKAQHSAPP